MSRWRDVLLLGAIAAAAFALRVMPAYDAVLGGAGVNFLETDSWYHARLMENQTRNWPWRVTLDPYAAPGGQFVPIAPLFDTIGSTAAVIAHGRDATPREVERIAAWLPPILGVICVVLSWLLARRLWGVGAAIVAAVLLAVLPGHFLDRTMLGFVDHHALEAALALAVLLLFAIGTQSSRLAPTDLSSAQTGSDPVMTPVAAGGALGLYLLSWGSGAFLVAILGAWLLLLVPLARTGADLLRASRTAGVAALVALVLVAAFQDPDMHRYGSQIAGLIGLAAIALAIAAACRRAPLRRSAIVAGMMVILAVALAVIGWAAPHLTRAVLFDVARLAPDPTRMAVLEARPLFLYPGNWTWSQPWTFFRTGFFIGLAALPLLAWRVSRTRDAADLLILVFAASAFIATIGQNRFGYYLVPGCALLGGWLSAEIFRWGGFGRRADAAPREQPVPLQREIAVLIVAGMMVAPNLTPDAIGSPRVGSLPPYWRDTMQWMRQNTPAPFAAPTGEDFYLARYDGVPPPGYSVMAWWDHGYWITQQARRVPIANPTQERAPIAGAFYSATSDEDARAILTAHRARFVISDWELPFRKSADGTIMGRFQSVVDWAGGDHSQYYDVYYTRGAGGGWEPLWVFHEPYYRSMAYRLTVLGGAAGVPFNSTAILAYVDRTDQSGRSFREVVSQQTYATFVAARDAFAKPSPLQRIIVGLDPWRSAFPIDALPFVRQVYEARTDDQSATASPWIRVFEVE